MPPPQEKSEYFGPMPPNMSNEELKAIDDANKNIALDAIDKRASDTLKTEEVSKREDWMILPPATGRATVALTNRTFSQKGVNSVDQAIWTASPSDRAQALVSHQLKVERFSQEEEDRRSKQAVCER